MRYYPVFLNLKDRKCVVIGGGGVAARKVAGLIEAGGDVTVISPVLCDELNRLLSEMKFTYISRGYTIDDIGDAFIVVAATDDRSLNERIYKDARCPVNVVDVPEMCSFILPSVARFDDLAIAVSSSGVSPALSRTIRLEIEDFLKREYGDNLAAFIETLKNFRKSVLNGVTNPAQREEILKGAGSAKTLSLLKEKGMNFVKERLNKISN